MTLEDYLAIKRGAILTATDSRLAAFPRGPESVPIPTRVQVWDRSDYGLWVFRLTRQGRRAQRQTGEMPRAFLLPPVAALNGWAILFDAPPQA